MFPAFTTATRYIIYALLIVTPLARGSVQGWAICAMHMTTLAALTCFLLDKSMRHEWKWITTVFDKPIFILSGLIILSSVFSVHRGTSFRAAALFFNYVIIFYIVIQTTRTRSQFRQLVYTIIGVAAFLSVFGMIKKFGISPFPWWNYDINQNTYRLTSTFGNPNHMAGYMEMVLLLISGLFLTDYREGKLFLMTYLTIIIAVALIMTFSRGTWIASLTSMFFMVICLFTSRYFKNKKLLIVLTFGIFVLVFIILSSQQITERIVTIMEYQDRVSFHSRTIVWKECVRLIINNSLLGTGPGTFAIVFTQYQPPGLNKKFTMAHNDYLHFVSEIGLPIVPIIIWMIFLLYKKGFKKFKNRSRLVRGITLGAMSGVTAMLIHSITDFNLHIPSNALLFTVLTALAAAPLPELTKRQSKRY
ncbi:MAG: hypothetical protein GY749_34735 [Desulfobacteraceae bacterium]|nr:hypothetical protein [Desulfobacteraceae bacterium]